MFGEPGKIVGKARLANAKKGAFGRRIDLAAAELGPVRLQTSRRASTPPQWLQGAKACFSGTVFLNLCPLYWGCWLAGYGNKRPSQ